MRKIILTLLMVVALFANEGAVLNSDNNISKEIGKPSLLTKVKFYTDFVPTKDGKEFYTYQNGTIFHWQLIPNIKMLNSFYVGMKDREIRFEKSSFMYLTQDETKMILINDRRIVLIDIKNQKIISSKQISSVANLLTKYGLVTIDVNSTRIPSNNGIDVLNGNRTISIWSTDSLQLIRKRNHDDPCKDIEECVSIPIQLFAISEQLAIYSQSHLMSVDLKNLEVKYQKYGGSLYGSMSLDKRYILFGKDSALDLLDGQVQKREQKVNPKTGLNLNKFYQFRKLILQFKDRNEKSFFYFDVLSEDNSTVQRIGSFLHDKDGNWIVWKGRGNFDTSLPLDKLTMRLKNGEVVPMNEATYKKYYKKIDIEGLTHGNY